VFHQKYETTSMKMYPGIIEKAPRNYGVFSPDVVGCVSSGATMEEAIENFREALQSHFEVMLDHGEFIPESQPVETHVTAYHAEGMELYSPEFIWMFIPADDVVPEQIFG
jgi:predicted RNase H-like HicB family nuclease